MTLLKGRQPFQLSSMEAAWKVTCLIINRCRPWFSIHPRLVTPTIATGNGILAPITTDARTF
ncbi:MAG: hypothetical protein ABGZ17_32035 [Planctomycetaceae bacterium]